MRGVFVGAVMQLDGNYPQTGAFVVRRLDSTPVLIHVTSAGFDNSEATVGMPSAYYESIDCSGTPFIPADVTNGFYPSHAGVAGTTAYHSVTAATTRTMQSYTEPCSTGANGICCVASGPYSSSFQEAVQFDLTTLGLVPPFHIDVP